MTDEWPTDGCRWLRPNHAVQLPLLCRTLTESEARNGNPYLTLSLTDRSGTIRGVIWNDAITPEEARESIGEVPCVVEVWARTEDYKGSVQLKISRISRSEDLVPYQFLPASEFDPDVMWGRLEQLLEKHVKTSPYELVLAEMFRVVGPRMQVSPAARNNHHAFSHGLLEHTLSMCELAVSIAEHYNKLHTALVRTPLLIAGVITHDIGKTVELDPVSREYTDNGELLGHIFVGVSIMRRAARAVDMRSDCELELAHLILSHHGRREWGSPVEPKTIEALILHQIDMLDSKVGMALSAFVAAGNRPWTEFIRPLGVRMRNRLATKE